MDGWIVEGGLLKRKTRVDVKSRLSDIDHVVLYATCIVVLF
jgi:hypothetical protein